ncbi:MAG: alkylation response protein AidB-like acyl-CoA dehydrogenase [Nonlabens sp.]|jgi:alkylation response protein AidB-like acyl-CoA dehydrogenase
MTTRTIFNADHEAFRESAAAFVDRSVMPRMEELGELHHHPRDMWLEAGAQGFLGLDVPAAYGGGEAGDWRFNAVLAEELSRASVATSSAFGIHYDVCAPYLVELTTDEQKQRWLPGFCSGQLVTAIGMTEPSGGSDLAALKTTAVREGDGWILNGSKTFITNGSTADLVIIAAATTPGGGSRGISLFVVEKGTPGFEPGRVLDKIGQPEADTAELFLTDVHVPAENMIGELDQGFIHMMENLAQERIGAAVANIAHARSILDETLVYIKERTAFGKPVGSFQHNAFLMADMVTRAEVTQAYVDQQIVAHTEGRLTAVDAAKSKWWTADVQGQILDACVQLHGGYGFMREYRVARAWADARVTRIWAGSNEIMKLIISRDLGL